MNVYANTCPMCCGDLDAAHPRTEDGVSRFCGCDTEASAYTPLTARRPDATAFNLGSIAMSDLAIARTPFQLNVAVA